MSYTYTLNLLINQGSDFTKTFQLAHNCVTRCPVKPSLVPSQIKIEPMGVTLPTGSILMIGCDDLVLSSPLSPTDRVISVTYIPSSIASGSIIQGPPINITGWQIRSSLKDKVNLLIANFTGSIVNPILGTFKLTLPSSLTTTIAANCDWQDYQGLDINILGQPISTALDTDTIKRYKKLTLDSYKWDLETIDTSNLVTRRAQGLALLSGEVTT